MTEINPSEGAAIPFALIVDPNGRTNADMHHISRSVHSALEYYRIGTEIGVNANPDEIEMGKGIIQCSMLAFALECALKGLFQALGEPFPGKHDLLSLFDKLPIEEQEKIQANWTEWTLFPETQETTFRGFVEAYRGDFVQWRYLEGMRLENKYMSWFAATEAVNAITRAVNE